MAGEDPLMASMPAHWNDAIRWGLRQLLGIPSTGTVTAIGVPTAPSGVRIAGSVTNQGGTSDIELQLPDTGTWALRRAHIVRTGGTAANWTPRLRHDSVYAAGGISEDVVWAAAAVGTPINDTPVTPIELVADAAGKLYLRLGWDAGTDNAASYELFFNRVAAAAGV